MSGIIGDLSTHQNWRSYRYHTLLLDLDNHEFNRLAQTAFIILVFSHYTTITLKFVVNWQMLHLSMKIAIKIAYFYLTPLPALNNRLLHLKILISKFLTAQIENPNFVIVYFLRLCGGFSNMISPRISSSQRENRPLLGISVIWLLRRLEWS